MAENIAFLTTTQVASSLGHLRRSVTQSLNPRGLLYRHDHLYAGKLGAFLLFPQSGWVQVLFGKATELQMLNTLPIRLTCVTAGYVLSH